MFSLPRSLVLLATFVGGAVQATPVNLLTNGDFETGNASGWTMSGNVNVTGSYGGNSYFGAGPLDGGALGYYALAFNAGDSAPNAVVSQSIDTIIGQLYELSFDYGVTWAGNQSLAVNVAGQGHVAQTTNTAFDHFSYNFVATSATTLLTFSDLQANYTFSQDGLIDNVSVTAVTTVPEPASLALAALALAGVAAVRRRR